MPSFYPSNANAFTSHGVGHGNGYKDACYQDMNDVSQQYHDFQHHDIHSHDLGPVLPNPFDRYAKMPTVYPPSQMYGYSYAANAHHNSMAAPAMNMAMPAVGRYYPGHTTDEPSRRQDTAMLDHAPVQAPEEKHVGGVSATLDYDMETMTDFVAETAFGIYELCASRICIADIDLLRSIRPGFGLPSSFRKWVLQVLHATRLPTATILLSLAYLAQRARQQTAAGVFDPSEVALYRSLTVALILGSKFLDDNTFQNKSWAEVSNISVIDLNKDEREWLMAFNHRLHQSPDCFDGFKSCEQLWTAFKSRKPSVTNSAAAARSVLQPISTNIRPKQPYRRQTPNDYRQRYLGKPGLSSFAVDPTLADPHYQAFLYPSMDVIHSHAASPASTQTTGPHTPEYYGGQLGWGVSESYHRSDLGYYQSDAYSAIHTPYNNKYGRSQGYGYVPAPMTQGQSYWNCHGVACQCSTCRHSHFVPHYGPAVAG